MHRPLPIFIQQRGYGARGPTFTVRLNLVDGPVLIDSTTQPMHDAARLLLSKGITGRLQMWDGVRPYWRLQGDIERLAAVTVTEGQYGLVLRKHAEHTQDGQGLPAPSLPKATRNGRPCLAAQGSGDDVDDVDLVDVDIGIGETPARSTPRLAVPG